MQISFANKQSKRSPARSPRLLSRDREADLVRRWQRDADEKALHELVTAYLPMVGGMARQFIGASVTQDDLIQEGAMGLIHAAARFEPERGFRFSTFAVWWVRAGLIDHAVRNRSIVRRAAGGPQRALFFNLHRLRRQPGNRATLAETANRLGVSEQAVDEMDAFLSYQDKSLDGSGNPESGAGPAEIPDGRPTPEEACMDDDRDRHNRDWLRQALTVLSEREKTIIVERHLAESRRTLREIGALFNISAERVRQIESSAFKKLRRFADECMDGLAPPQVASLGA